MKRWLLSMLVLLCCCGGGVAVAEDITAEKWKVDVELYTEALNKSPKDYVTALNLSRKWVQFAEQDLATVRAATGNPEVTAADLQGVANNIYREAAQVIVKDYVQLMKKDPLGAANFVINLQQWFKDRPEVFAEFAAANNSAVGVMQETFDQAVRAGIIKTYDACAKEYSRLVQAGKTDEAKKLSEGWQKVVSHWEANNSALPDAFKAFAGIDPTETLYNMKRFEKDYAAWRKAVDEGDEETALSLVAKWVKFEKDNPEGAKALHYLHTAIVGGTPADDTNWDMNFYTATYVQLWKHDVEAYTRAIAAGDLETAKALVVKWQKLLEGTYGESIATHLGSTKDAMLATLA